ncbi:MAG: cytochrome c biogenesis protein ResB [Actinomycetales bacterium]|nr:cytochrome c biogenesis protein ResB [Actinomycetales bacterium]
MSNPRSDRPADHVDAPVAPAAPVNPRLSPVGWLRFLWRLLTSMRTALVLLLLLALAAVPGSLVPQRSSDPNGVIQYQRDNPDLFTVLDGLGVFSTFSSPWFSAVYLLLFLSLVGCVIPRTKHHVDALRARPPRTPQRLERLVGFTTRTAAGEPERIVDRGRAVLRGLGYRVERYDRGGELSISAERGYLRETGNLVFHVALLGVLLAVGVGGGFIYTGQRVLVQDTAFTNTLASYDSINPGRFFDESKLEPYSLRLDDFTGSYEFDAASRTWKPVDFTASLSTREPGGDWTPAELKVNHPLQIGGTAVYLLGNGYAPEITVRNPAGEAVFSGPVVFRPQDANLFSLGVIKVPDGLDRQLGMIGLFYPDPIAAGNGALASFSPEANDPILTLEVYAGDLGLDTGVPVNVYQLDTDGLEQLVGRSDALKLGLGDTVDLPDGLGTIEFSGLRRYVALDIHHDPTQGWVLLAAVTALGGLLLSLFIPRRRLWIKVRPGADGVTLEYAGLARGEDPALERVVAELADRHAREFEPVGPAPAGSEPAESAPEGSVGPERRIEP